MRGDFGRVFVIGDAGAVDRARGVARRRLVPGGGEPRPAAPVGDPAAARRSCALAPEGGSG